MLHVQRIYCQTASCQYNRIGFANRSALNAHIRRHHSQSRVLLIPSKIRRATIAGEEIALKAHTSVSIDSSIKCVCRFTDDDGNTVLCEKCETWQHIVCYYEYASYVPEVHECCDCDPRPIDRELATKRQLQLRNLPAMPAYLESGSDSQSEPKTREIESAPDARLSIDTNFSRFLPHYQLQHKASLRTVSLEWQQLLAPEERSQSAAEYFTIFAPGDHNEVEVIPSAISWELEKFNAAQSKDDYVALISRSLHQLRSYYDELLKLEEQNKRRFLKARQDTTNIVPAQGSHSSSTGPSSPPRMRSPQESQLSHTSGQGRHQDNPLECQTCGEISKSESDYRWVVQSSKAQCRTNVLW
jgi:hypothetical protein